MDRRHFITAGAAAGITALASNSPAQTPPAKPIMILGISASPRPGKTTATSVQLALDAARIVNDNVQTRLIDLGGMNIAGHPGPSDQTPANSDDFTAKVLPEFQNPNLGGIIIGSPVYFRTLSSLCKAFLERLAVLRKPNLLLADLPVGALSVGGYRNGGQELVIDQILMTMLCHEVMAVGGKPGAHQGATLWNNSGDDITKDELGIASAKNLGTRVAQAAVLLKKQKL